MKQLLIIFAATLIFLPCLAILNESDSFIPNIIGFIYIAFLAILFRTKYGRKQLLTFYRTIIKLNNNLRL